MKQLLIIALAAVSATAFATDWATQLYYGIGTKQTAIVASTKLTSFTNVLGKGWTLDLDAFAGSFSSGAPVAGVLIGKRIPLADQVNGYVGIAFSAVQGRPTDFGPCVGISVKF